MWKQLGLWLGLIPMLCFGQTLDQVIAIVNDSVITQSELSAETELLRLQMTAKRMELPSDVALKKQVLEHLIDVELQLALAKQHNVVVDDAELKDTIEKIAAKNELSLQHLQEAVEAQGLSWQRYQNNLRKEMILARLQQKAVGKDMQVTQEEVEDYLKSGVILNDANSRFHLQNIVIPLPEEPTPEQIMRGRKKALALLAELKQGRDFSRLAIEHSSGEFALEGGDLGDRHLAELPQVFAKEVVRMKVGEVSAPIRTGNGFQLIKLVAMRGENEKYTVTKTHVRHILLKPDASTTPKEAEKQAHNIYEQLKSGKNFSLMAKQYSLDAMSASNGGDLGWVGPGELVPEFEKTMNTLSPHQVSQPVKSIFGWHIIEVLERKTMDDSEAFKRQQVRRFLEQRKFTNAVQNWQQHLRATAYIKVLDKIA